MPVCVLKGRADLLALTGLPSSVKVGNKEVVPALFEQSDESLMLLYLDGDFAAFEEIYRRFAPRVYGYIQRRVQNSTQSEELFQAVFLKFHRSRHSFKRGEPVAPWLFTLSRNCIRDWARRKAVEIRAQELLEAEPAPGVGSSDCEGALTHPTLSLREREVLSLRFEHDLPFSSIGARIGASAASARQIAHRAIVKLKKAFSDGPED